MFFDHVVLIRIRQFPDIMDRMPTEIILSIFKMYLEEPATMPLPLVGVCRKWHNIVKATPSFCFRVVIDVKSEDVIPFILASPGLENYLSLTDTDERDRGGYSEVLLDIEIRSRLPSVQEHDRSCDGPFVQNICQGTLCGYAMKRRNQVDRLLSYLVGPSRIRSAGNRNGNRIERWRSLALEFSSLFTKNTQLTYHNPNELLPNTSLCAPRLVYLALNGVPSPYMPKDTFAPNITSLSIMNTAIGQPKNFRKLRCLWTGGEFSQWSHIRDTIVFDTVVELHLICTQWKHPIIFPKLPALKVMKIYQRCPSPNIPQNVKAFNFDDFGMDNADGGESNRLEEVHLIGILPPTLVALKSSEKITMARKIVLQNTPRLLTTTTINHDLSERHGNVQGASVKSYKQLRFFKLLRQSINLFKYSSYPSTKPSRRPPFSEPPEEPPLSPPTPPSSPFSSSCFPSPSSSVSSLLSVSSTDSFETSSPHSLLKAFIRACAVDTEFMAVDESSEKCLEAVLEQVEATRWRFPPIMP